MEEASGPNEEMQKVYARQGAVDYALKMATEKPRTAAELVADAKVIADFLLGAA